MDWSKMEPTLYNATFIAALIAAMVSIVGTIINNRRIRAIEHDKKSASLDQFRYEKLFSLLTEISSLEMPISSNPNSHNRESVKLFAARFDNLLKIYELVKPLISKPRREKIDTLIESNWEYTHKYESRETDFSDSSVYNRLFRSRLEIEITMKKLIQEQLYELLIA